MDAMQILWKMSMMLKTLKNDAETKPVASVKKIDESQVELKKTQWCLPEEVADEWVTRLKVEIPFLMNMKI